MITVQTNLITNDTIQKIKEHQKIHFEKLGNWIVAGSGNYEKTQNDGRYRTNCNTYKDTITCEDHKVKGIKVRFYHCNKLDCENCFIHASSARARKINNKLLELKREAKENGIKTGNIIHLVLSPKPEFVRSYLKDYKSVKRLRRKIFRMLKDSGMFAGVLFTQLHSLKCENCGERAEDCTCGEKKLNKSLNPHFHALGYGYLTSSEEFREKYEGWMYLNLGRREDAYHTIFYILTQVAIWRKEDGNLNPAYQSFGWLKSNKLVPITQRVVYQRDKCPICRKPRKEIVRGIHKIANKKAKKLFDPLRKGNFLIAISEKDLMLGKEVLYKRILIKYSIKNVETLRNLTTENILRYRNYRRKKAKDTEKAGNGYG